MARRKKTGVVCLYTEKDIRQEKEKVLLTGEPSLFLFTFADINIIAGRYGKAFRS